MIIVVKNKKFINVYLKLKNIYNLYNKYLFKLACKKRIKIIN